MDFNVCSANQRKRRGGQAHRRHRKGNAYRKYSEFAGLFSSTADSLQSNDGGNHQADWEFSNRPANRFPRLNSTRNDLKHWVWQRPPDAIESRAPVRRAQGQFPHQVIPFVFELPTGDSD